MKYGGGKYSSHSEKLEFVQRFQTSRDYSRLEQIAKGYSNNIYTFDFDIDKNAEKFPSQMQQCKNSFWRNEMIHSALMGLTLS